MRVIPYFGFGAFLVCLSASTACDDSTGGAGGGATGLTVDTYYDAYSNARCDYFVRCGYLTDKTQCAEAYGADRGVAQGVASVVFGGLGFDAEKAKTCVDSFALALCNVPPTAGVAESIDDACDAVFTGKGADGAACFNGVECQSGFCETMGGGNQCNVGVCKDQPLIASGGDCTGGKACVETDFCDTEDGNVCKPRKGANEACSSPLSCIEGYVCDDQGGKCFKASPSGASCNPTLVTTPCEQAASEYCHPDTKTCTKLPAVGEPCVASGPNMNGCSREGYCDNSTGTNVCKKLPGEGEMCVGGNACLGTLQCDMDTMLCERSPTHTCIPD